MFKKRKLYYIWTSLGLGIFISIIVCLGIFNNSKKTIDNTIKDNIIELDESTIIEKVEDNNQLITEESEEIKEITSKQVEKEDLSINQKDTISNNQINISEKKTIVEEKTYTEKKSNKKEETASTEVIEENKEEISSEVKEEIKQEEQSNNQNDEIDNSVDTNSLDYNEHKGRINCFSSSECMSISLPIQAKYKKNISHSSYIDVISISGDTIGYFIEYHFKEYTYSSNEECESVGSEIKQTLIDIESKIIMSYQCNGSTLKIYTDY